MKYLILLLLTFSISAGVKVTAPPCTLYNSDGVQVGTKSYSVSKAIEKASDKVGTYTLSCPDVTIKITRLTDINIPPVAVTGGDITCIAGEKCYLPSCDDSYDPDGKIVNCELKQLTGVPVEILHDKEGRAYFIAPGIPNNDPEV